MFCGCIPRAVFIYPLPSVAEGKTPYVGEFSSPFAPRPSFEPRHPPSSSSLAPRYMVSKTASAWSTRPEYLSLSFSSSSFSPPPSSPSSRPSTSFVHIVSSSDFSLRSVGLPGNEREQQQLHSFQCTYKHAHQTLTNIRTHTDVHMFHYQAKRASERASFASFLSLALSFTLFHSIPTRSGDSKEKRKGRIHTDDQIHPLAFVTFIHLLFTRFYGRLCSCALESVCV